MTKSFVAGVLLMVCTGLAYAMTNDRVILPGAIYPAHYDLTIVPDAAHLNFKGTVVIDLEVKTATPAIELNAVDLTFDRVNLSGRTDAPKVRFDPVRETASIAFAQPVVAGNYRLEIEYHGKINQQASGLFALDYTAADKTKKRALYTQFENSDARRFMPCWDEPGIKSTFTLVLDVPAQDMAVSNMPTETSVASGATKKVRFAMTPKMSVYLIFAGVGDFERVHRMVGKTDLGIVVKRGDTARASFALDAASQLLPYYNDYFGTPYALPKLDIIAAPGSSDFFSAMENWGALFHFESAVLVDSKLSTEADRQRVYVVIAHEMAHQWFGDLVTMAWWDDLWLNEGFASWMENKATDRFHPEWKIWLQDQSDRQAAMLTDSSVGTHPIVTPIRNVLEANGAFDEITYVKGASVIRMLEAYVGENAFRAGVRSYIKAFAYGNSVSDDLWMHIDAAGGKPITDIAHDFTLQAGVPLILVGDVHCVRQRQVFSLTQARFSLDDSAKHAGQIWRVPVQFGTLADNTVASTVVRGKLPVQASIAGCQPVLVNPGQPGYYRIRYDAESSAALTLHFRALAAEDQLGLLDNAAALASIGQAPLSDYLDLARALPPAADPVVWRALAQQLGMFDELLAGQPSQAMFRVFARDLLLPVFAPLGWDATPDESDNAALLRATLIATLGQIDDAAILDEAGKRFAQFTQQPGLASAAVRKAVLNAVAVHADTARFEDLRAMARTAPSEIERRDYYEWLGSSVDAAIAQRALELVLSSEAPLTLRTRIIRAVAVRHAELATDFTIAHWDQIAQLVTADSRFEFVPKLAGNSADRRVIERLSHFEQAQFPTAGRGALEKAIGKIRYRAQLRDRLVESATHDAFATRAPAAAP